MFRTSAKVLLVSARQLSPWLNLPPKSVGKTLDKRHQPVWALLNQRTGLWKRQLPKVCTARDVRTLHMLRGPPALLPTGQLPMRGVQTSSGLRQSEAGGRQLFSIQEVESSEQATCSARFHLWQTGPPFSWTLDGKRGCDTRRMCVRKRERARGGGL